jgi:WXG100 family type VII secretion target
MGTNEDYQGSINTLNTKDFVGTAESFKKLADGFTDIKDQIRDATNDLLEVWQGDARNLFEKKYDFLYSKLEDIEDWLVDTYDAIMDAYTTYEDADQAVSDGINAGDGSSESGKG